MNMKNIYVCSGCKSDNVVKLAWVNPNYMNSFVSYYDGSENSYCYDCGCSITKVKQHRKIKVGEKKKVKQ
jgi:hypothetical protein